MESPQPPLESPPPAPAESRPFKLHRRFDRTGRLLGDTAMERLAQARQIEAVIASTKEIDALVKTARKETDEKFETARELFAQSRTALAELRSQ